MDEEPNTPRNLLAVAVFCAIIGLIGVAGFLH